MLMQLMMVITASTKSQSNQKTPEDHKRVFCFPPDSEESKKLSRMVRIMVVTCS